MDDGKVARRTASPIGSCRGRGHDEGERKRGEGVTEDLERGKDAFLGGCGRGLEKRNRKAREERGCDSE